VRLLPAPTLGQKGLPIALEILGEQGAGSFIYIGIHQGLVIERLSMFASILTFG